MTERRVLINPDKTVSVDCQHCGANMIPGPRGDAAQNFYCTNRTDCRQGENLTIWRGSVVMAEQIGEVADEAYEMYAE